MKKTWIICAIFSCLAICTLGCDPELKELLDDYYAEAPGFCKEQCSLQAECEIDQFEDYTSGEFAQDAFEQQERLCVLECTLPCTDGVYLVTEDYDYYDYEVSYDDYASGSEYKKFASCAWEAQKDYYTCDDGDWYFEYDETDQEFCEALNGCYEDFNEEWSCSWETEYGYSYCDCDTNDQYLS